MSRLDKERKNQLEPKRMSYAIEKLSELGVFVEKKDETTLRFWWKNEIVTYYPYSGWHTGKSIIDGRGIDNLLNQLKK